MKKLLVTLFLLLFVLGPINAYTHKRPDDILLDGMWQYAEAGDINQPPQSADWQDIAVPHYLYEPDGNACIWFKRTCNVADITGPILLRCDSIKFRARVFVNNQFAGEHIGGFMPFELEVQDMLVPGENTIHIGVQGVGACYGASSDIILYPIGSQPTSIGICGSVVLSPRSSLTADWLKVDTSLSAGRITIHGEYRNLSQTQQESQVIYSVLDQGTPVHVFPAQSIAVPGGGSQTVQVIAAMPDLELWQPFAPKLYTLQARVDGHETVRVEFGAREVAIAQDGLYVNGQLYQMLGCASHPSSNLVGQAAFDAHAVELYDRALQAKGRILRLHAQPWQQAYYDLADTIGFPLTWESALWCNGRQYAFDQPAFWQHFRDHIHAQVREHGNRPSVMIWSLENELLLTGGDWYAGTESQLAALADYLRTLDAGRPVMYDGDYDPIGNADIINLHYPHEIPLHQLFPDTAYFLEEPFAPDTYPHGTVLYWDQQKPLVIGEFAWCPPYRTAPWALFYGDAVYREYPLSYYYAKAQYWRQLIPGYRYSRVTGICPWNCLEDATPDRCLIQAQAACYHPVQIFRRDQYTAFYSQTSSSHRFFVVNDSSSHFSGQATITLAGRFSAQHPLDLPAGERMEFTETIPTGAAGAPLLTMSISSSRDMVFQDTQVWHIEDAAVLATSRRVGLYDPNQELGPVLEAAGLTCERVDNIRVLDQDLDLVIVAASALPMNARLGDPAAPSLFLHDYIACGGRVLVLPQGHGTNLLGAGCRAHTATISHLLAPGEPLAEGLADSRFSYFYPGHRVCDYAFTPFHRGRFRYVAGASGETGFAFALLQSKRWGDGRAVFCAYDPAQGMDTAPQKRRILHNMITGLEQDLPPEKTYGVYSDDLTFIDYLDYLDAEYTQVSPPFAGVDVLSVKLDALDDTAWTAIQAMLDAGKPVVLHALSAGDLEKVNSLADVPLSFASAYALPLIIGADAPETLGLTHEFLFWQRVHRINHRDYAVPSANIVDKVLHKGMTAANPQYFNVLDMERQCSACYEVGAGLACYSDTTLTFALDVSTGGDYVFALTGQGTDLLGEYPLMTLMCDDQMVGRIAVGEAMGSYYAYGGLDAGQHTFALVFGNDKCGDEGDINVYLETFSLGPDQSAQDMFLTSPGALVKPCAGKPLYIELLNDELEQENRFHAMRCFITFMGNLGVPFADLTYKMHSLCLTDFQPRDLLVYGIDAERMFMADNGELYHDLDVASSGDYQLVLVASGTPVQDVYPYVYIKIDGQTQGHFYLDTAFSKEFRKTITLAAGAHELALEFTNDDYQPPEDRNVYIYQVGLVPLDIQAYAADLNQDGKVDSQDVGIMLHYQDTAETLCDLDQDGTVTTADLRLLIACL